MGSLNKVMVMGNLGSDPEVRFTQGGNAVANFRLATSEKWTDKSGQKQEKTEWHRIVAWGKTAEVCGEHLRKGASVLVEGKLQTREWEQDGAKRYTTEIVAERVTFVGSGGGATGGGERQPERRDNRTAHQRVFGDAPPVDDSDIPF